MTIDIEYRWHSGPCTSMVHLERLKLIYRGISAFGGMIAFCIIVGDTIPHVMAAVFPSLRDMPFLWLLTNRRAVIVIFILGVSYPLSLYRDIAKASSTSSSNLTSADICVAC